MSAPTVSETMRSIKYAVFASCQILYPAEENICLTYRLDYISTPEYNPLIIKLELIIQPEKAIQKSIIRGLFSTLFYLCNNYEWVLKINESDPISTNRNKYTTITIAIMSSVFIDFPKIRPWQVNNMHFSFGLAENINF